MAMALGRIKHWIRLATDAEYREVDRLLNLPRKQAGTTMLLGRALSYVDARSCALQHRVIFKHGIYAIRCDGSRPRILDIGANIGMATIYLKRLFPSAKIDAFEADPEIVQVLRKNISSFDLHDVEVHHAAASDKEGSLFFVSNGADGGHLARSTSEDSVAVPAVRLRDWLEKPTDFLKLDVEGAEFGILADCRDRLKNVSQLFVEYHSFSGEKQQLPELLFILRDAGFRIFIQTDYCAPAPLNDPVCDGPMDLRLNIFGSRLG